jgi:type II secretory pathway component PulF
MDDLANVEPVRKVIQPRSIRFRLIARAIAWGLCLGLFVFVVPRIEAVFAEYNLPLPQNTDFAISAAHRVIRFRWLILVGLILVIPGAEWLTPVMLSGPTKSDMSRALSTLMLAIPLVLIVLTLIALSSPFFCLCPMRLTG